MTNKAFDDFVAKQTSETQRSQLDWSKERDEWLRYLEKFYKKVESFLHDYLSKGQIKIDYVTKKISEEYIGVYEVKSAIIQLGRNQIRLDPIGTNLIGAKGRVDMIGPNGEVKFLLVRRHAPPPKVSILPPGMQRAPEPEEPTRIEWSWKIATSPPPIKYIELQQESFFDALMEVANG